MRIVASDGVTPAPLFLHKRSPSGDIVFTLRVDAPIWWTFQLATVIRAPINALAGRQFQDVASAWAELQKSLGERGGGQRYLEELAACIMGDIDERLLGEELVQSSAGEGEIKVQRHSPQLSTQSVQSLEEPAAAAGAAAVGGRWLTTALLRPFAPHALPEGEAREQVAEMIRTVRLPATPAPLPLGSINRRPSPR